MEFVVDTKLKPVKRAEPVTAEQYRRAAVTLARFAGDDATKLREGLEMIGFPGVHPHVRHLGDRYTPGQANRGDVSYSDAHPPEQQDTP